MSEPVGSIPVLITGDWSDLAAALQQATAAASAGAGQIASAFTSAASGAGGLEAAMNSLANTTKGTQASFYSLQTATQAEGAAALQAAGDLQLMSQQVQQTGGDFAYASSLMEKMATQLQAMTAASAEATKALQGFASQAQQTGSNAESGAINVGDLMSAFGKVAGITIGIAALRGFGESAVEAFAQVERGQIAFTYLTGSAQQAAEAMQGFRSISMDLALPFDSVVSFSQQLLAAGVSVNQLGTAITDAADAAAARGVSFDTAASAIERITETGNVSSKVLRQLGLSMDDLAEATGIDVKNIKEFFASLDDGGRLDVLTVALEKFKGASKAVADSTSGDIQRIKDAWTFALQDIGEALVKAESGGSGFSGIVTVIKVVETVILELIVLFQDLGAVVGGVTATIVTGIQSITRALTASSWSQFFAEVKSGFIDTAAVSQSTWDQMAADAQRAADKINNIWSTHMHDATPDQYSAFNKQAAADRTDAAAGAFVPKPKGGSSPIDPMITEFNRLDDATTKLLHDVDTDYQDYLGTLEQGGKKASALVHELAAEISKAEVALPHMSGVYVGALSAIIDSLQTALANQKKFSESDELLTFAEKSQKQFEGLVDKTDALSDSFDKMADKAGIALTKTGSGFATTTSYGATLVGQVEVIPGIFDRIGAAGNRALSDQLDFLNKTGVAWDGAKVKINDLLPGFDKFFNSQLTSLPQLDAEWAKYGKQIEQAALAGVPEAIKAWSDYIAAIGRLKSPIAEAIAEEDQLSKKIAEGVLAGKQVGDLVFQYEKEAIAIREATEAAKQMSEGQMFAIASAKIAEQDLSNTRHQMSQAHLIELAQMTVAMEAHRDVVNLASDSYRLLQRDVVAAFEGFGQAIGKDIADFKSFHQLGLAIFADLEKAVKKLAEKILSDLVGNALKALGEKFLATFTDGDYALSGLAKKLLGTGDTVGSAAKELSGAAGTLDVAGKSMTDASQTLSGAADKLSEAVKNFQDSVLNPSGGGDSSGGFDPTPIGIVSGVVDAVSNVISAFELKQMLHKLAVIEENTRKSAILAQQTSDNLTTMHQESYSREGEILGAIWDVTGNIVHLMEGSANEFNRLGDIWKTLLAIYDGIGNLGAIVADGGVATTRSGPTGTPGSVGTGVTGSGGGGRGGEAGTGGAATIGGAYVPSSPAILAALGVLAQAVQELGAMESQVSQDVKRLASQEVIVTGILSSMALEMAKLGLNTQPLAADLVGVGMNINDVADHLQNVSDGQAAVGSELFDIANNIQEQTKIDTTGQQNFANAQAQSNTALDSINQATGQTYQAASATQANTAKGASAAADAAAAGFTTVRYMGIAAAATGALQVSTDAVAASTDATATSTANSADQLTKIVEELKYADKLLFLDKLVWLDKLDGIDKSAAAIYTAVTGVYTATAGGFAGVSKQLDAIEATLTAIEGKLTAVAASFPTVTPGIPPITGGLPPLGAVIINWDLSRQMQEEFGAAIAAYLAAHPPDSSNPNGPGSGVSPTAPHSFASAHSSPAIPFSFSATGAGLPSGPISTSNTVHIAAINIYDAQTPRQSADAIMRELSKRSPKFSQAATRTR